MNLPDKLREQGKQKFWTGLEVQGVIDKGGRHWKDTAKNNVINHRLDTLIDSTHQATVEEIIKIIEEELEKGTGIGAIPETTDYAKGWNDGRKEAYKMRKKTLLSLIEAIKK